MLAISMHVAVSHQIGSGCYQLASKLLTSFYLIYAQCVHARLAKVAGVAKGEATL